MKIVYNFFSRQPTLIEQEEWIRLNPEYKSLPAIAEYRLPFLPKVDIWKLISKCMVLYPVRNL